MSGGVNVKWLHRTCLTLLFRGGFSAGKNPNNMSDLQRAAEARQFLMDMAPQGPGNGGAGGSGNSRQSNWKT